MVVANISNTLLNAYDNNVAFGDVCKSYKSAVDEINSGVESLYDLNSMHENSDYIKQDSSR